jgi:hypothetical protein
MEEAFADAQLGPAAYALGVHYFVQDKLDQADYWLRVAARNDIGDATLRLAQLCELRAVRNFNQSEVNAGLAELSYEQSVEAKYWHGRALADGYNVESSGNSAFTDQPTAPLDCCDQMSTEKSLLEAEQLLEEARQEADQIVRTARSDARRFVHDARQEIKNLAQQREFLASQLAQLGSVLHGLAGLLGNESAKPRKPIVGWLVESWVGKRVNWSQPSSAQNEALSADMEYCAEILKSFQCGFSDPAVELPLRTIAARAVAAVGAYKFDAGQQQRPANGPEMGRAWFGGESLRTMSAG